MASAQVLKWPLPAAAAGGYALLDGVRVNSVADYRWMVFLGGFLAFAMAWGIGANDVANAFATSVGAGSLTLRSACIIAAVMEFLGAMLMGNNVTDTVRKKIIRVEIFDTTNYFDPEKPNELFGAANGPEVLMTGFLVALISATTWLILATYLSLPVSTTHSIIGSLVGVGLAFRGSAAVIWVSGGTGLSALKGVAGVVASWVISPLLSAIIAILVFLLVRHTVLRTKNPVRNGYLFLPLFTMMTIAIAIFFIIYKGSPKLKLADRFSIPEAVGIALGTGTGVAILSWWLVIPQIKRLVDRWEAREIEKMKNPEAFEDPTTGDNVNKALAKVGVNLNIDEELADDVVRMHDNVEKFDPKAEQLFTWLQVFTAAFDAFAHGANDVANSIAPFASIFALHKEKGMISEPLDTPSTFDNDGTYSGGASVTTALTGPFKKGDAIQNGKSYCGAVGNKQYFACQDRFPYKQGGMGAPVNFSLYNETGAWQKEAQCFEECQPGTWASYKTKKQDVDLWILALGGLGIVLGLAMWGYRIIVAIGVKLTKLTPSRGFSIEIGAAITVIIASRLGLPVSTTHCQVGATMGVGLVEFKGNTVNWKQFGYICLGWVFTVVLTGAFAAALFSLLIRTPRAYSARQPFKPTHCPGQNMFVFDPVENGFRGISCSGVPKGF